MRDVLVLCPQERDRKAIGAARIDDDYRVTFVGEDLDALPDFDPQAIIAEAAALPADGAVGTKDRSALLAALVAERRGLPGPTPGALVRIQHKPTAREILERVAPEAAPNFAVVNGTLPPFPPPYFVKPVVGRLSQSAHRVDVREELLLLPPLDEYRVGWGRIAALAGFPLDELRGYVAEELKGGLEVTLEGYVHGGRLVVIGVTDSLKYPGTDSFERFEYPSRLPESRQAELRGIAERLLDALEFDGGFFNAEFFVPAGAPATLIEVNGRIASQFAPLVAAVHGRSSYEALLALACGDDPRWNEGEPRGVAVSYVLRRFEDAPVLEAPEPDARTEILVRPGRRLSEQGTNDAHSYRLAIVYEAGETREEAVRRARERARSLPFRLG
jgi:hypothetical protein